MYTKQNCEDDFKFSTYGTHGEVCLTKRESACMVHIMKGKTAKEIGKQMNISHRTVESYIEKIKKKTGCWTRSELVNYGFESGFIQLLI